MMAGIHSVSVSTATVISALTLLLLHYSCSAQTTYGVVGGKAALPCNITPPTPDDAVSLILWYKEESTTPIYRLVA
jgi:hypothetical protein